MAKVTSNMYGKKISKIGGYQYKRKNGMSGKKLVWKVLNAMQDKNINRYDAVNDIHWANNAEIFHTWRLFQHDFQVDGGGAGIDYMDFGNTLTRASYQVQTNVDAGTNDGDDIIDPKYERFQLATDPDKRIYCSAKLVLRLKNNSDIPVRMEVCYYEAKINIPANDGGVVTSDDNSDWIPQRLWARYLGSDYGVQSNVTEANLANTHLSRLSDANNHIKQYWKRVKTMLVALGPGETLNLSCYKKKVFSLFSLKNQHLMQFNTLGTQTGLYAMKGEPIIQIKFKGDISHDSTTRGQVNYAGNETHGASANNESIDCIATWDITTNVAPSVGRKFFHYEKGTVASTANQVEISKPATAGGYDA